MSNRNRLRFLAAIVLLVAPLTAVADAYRDELLMLQRAVSVVNSADRAQAVPALEQLAAKARTLVAANPGRAEPLVWEGIVLSKLSGAKANMSALGDAKQALKNFEAAAQLDPKALDWAAHTLRAQLYWHVPGWPIGFGDKKRAVALFEQAIALNPEAAEPRYFYGEYLLNQKQYKKAAEQFRIAATAPLRQGQQVDPATGFACNAMICRNHTPETDARFRTASERSLAKAEAAL